MTIDGILIAVSSPERQRLLVDEIASAGWTGVACFDPARADALTHVRALNPTAIVLELGTAARAERDQAFRIAREGRWPVIVFVDIADVAAIEAAVAAGVSSYVVKGLVPGRVRSVVETGVSRFREMERLRRERDEAVSAFDAFYSPVGR